MKVLLASHYFPPHVGGIEIVAANQAKHLAQLGYDITVMTSAIGEKKGRTLQDGYHVVRLPASNYFENKFNIPFPLFSFSIHTKAYQLVKEADVVHIHDAFYLSNFVLALWAKVLDKPLVLTQHVEIIPHPNRAVMFIQKLVYGTTGKFIFSSAEKIVIYNSRVRDFLINRGVNAEDIVVILNGVDSTLFKPVNLQKKHALRRKYGLPEKELVALFVGRFVAKKGFYKLLEASDKSYTIAFAGGSQPKNQQKQDNLIFLGSLTKQEVAEVYKACDLFVLPSEGEGFPLSIQEAMASGLPILAGTDPGYSLYNLDSELFRLINPTVPEMKKYLGIMAKDSELRKAMGEYSHAYTKKHFNWDRSAENLATLYRGLLP